MGLEKIHFFWYVKKISGLALVGYLAGAGVYLAQYQLLHWLKAISTQKRCEAAWIASRKAFI